MEEMFIRVSWTPDLFTAGTPHHRRKELISRYISEAIAKSAMGQRVKVKPYLENPVLFSYDDLKDFEDEDHDAILDKIREHKADIVMDAFTDLDIGNCLWCGIPSQKVNFTEGFCNDCYNESPKERGLFL